MLKFFKHLSRHFGLICQSCGDLPFPVGMVLFLSPMHGSFFTVVVLGCFFFFSHYKYIFPDDFRIGLYEIVFLVVSIALQLLNLWTYLKDFLPYKNWDNKSVNFLPFLMFWILQWDFCLLCGKSSKTRASLVS